MNKYRNGHFELGLGKNKDGLEVPVAEELAACGRAVHPVVVPLL